MGFPWDRHAAFEPTGYVFFAAFAPFAFDFFPKPEANLKHRDQVQRQVADKSCPAHCRILLALPFEDHEALAAEVIEMEPGARAGDDEPSTLTSPVLR